MALWQERVETRNLKGHRTHLWASPRLTASLPAYCLPAAHLPTPPLARPPVHSPDVTISSTIARPPNAFAMTWSEQGEEEARGCMSVECVRMCAYRYGYGGSEVQVWMAYRYEQVWMGLSRR